MAQDADRYFKQDTDINRYQKMVTNVLGNQVPDIWSANNKIPTNWYFYFVVQGVQYLLGNGVTFKQESTKAKLGKDFDQKIQKLAEYAKNGSCSYGFWNLDHIDVFSYLEFVPLPDEKTNKLRAGIRFWQLDAKRPLYVVLYEEDGMTTYIRKVDKTVLEIEEEKHGYVRNVVSSEVDGERTESYENYGSFPIVPLKNINDQSDLYGNKQTIDSYELTLSQMTNNGTQGQLLYWMFKNCGGYDSDAELEKVVERIVTTHTVSVGGSDDVDVKPYTVETPVEGNEKTLKQLKDQMFHDFMALNVDDIKSGNVVVPQIEAAYEPLNQKTDKFEAHVTEFINGILEIAGIEDEPSYTRSTIANKSENIQSLLSCSEYLDREFMVKQICTLLGSPDEAKEVIKRLIAEETTRFNNNIDEGGEGVE